MHPRDRRLIDGFLRGEATAVERLRGCLWQATAGYRRRLLLPWEDLQQELLVEIVSLLRRGAFRGESRLETFLWRIVQCRCLNRLRDQWKLRSADVEGDLDRFESPDASPLDRILRREARELLTRFAESMPPACHEMWEMILAGWSYRQMSRALGVSEGALRVRLSRCRRQAAARWQDWRASRDRGPSAPTPLAGDGSDLGGR